MKTRLFTIFAFLGSILLFSAAALIVGSLLDLRALPVARAIGPLYVSTTGSDSNDCLSPKTACRTIQAAVHKASFGDTINIAAGTYTENINITEKSLLIQGADAANTIIDGGRAGPVIYVGTSPYINLVTISDVTVRNGKAEQGGGIHNEYSTVALVIPSAR